MTEERENKIRETLANLSGLETHEINLNDHPDAWEVIENLLDWAETNAYAGGYGDGYDDGRRHERDEWMGGE